MRIQLHLLDGEQIEQQIHSNVFVIGRSIKCDVVVPHEGMSRQHCQIELVNGEIYVTDLGSTNGVMIDGIKIEPHKRTHYATYLVLAFGAVVSMQVTLDDPTDSMKLAAIYTAKKERDQVAQATSITSMTRTKTLAETLKPTSAATPKPLPQDEKSSRARSIMINLLCFMILAASVWWYVQNDKEDKTSYDSAEDSEQVDMDSTSLPDSEAVH
jgi:predicted component of type VI protein secretion system